MFIKPAFPFSSAVRRGVCRFLGASPGGAAPVFSLFWPLALSQQAPLAIVLQALRRLGGALLFPVLRPSSGCGFPFLRLALTRRSSGSAYCGPLTLPVRP